MKNLPIAVFCALAFITASPTVADLPEGISYQGYLTDNAGVPVSGSLQIAFDLYDAEAGGQSLWSEIQLVTVTNGLFAVRLGNDFNPFPASAFQAPVWLAITVESDEQMQPRRPILTSVYAFRARMADTVSPAAVCMPGDFVNCYTGPAGTLHVGLCQSGVRTCSAGSGFGACNGEVTPTQEVCLDDLDNNCDGDVDDGCDCLIYRDMDSDGFGDPADFINDCGGQQGYVANNLDCYDSNPNVRPGQTSYFTVNRGDGSFDYNCDGAETKEDIAVGSCPASPPCDATPGWLSAVPNCGQTAQRLAECEQVFFDCEPVAGANQTQSCR